MPDAENSNPPSITVRLVGHEREPVAIVENFAPDPEALRAAAARAAFAPDPRHYPGIRAALPADYMAGVRPALSEVMREVFGFTRGARVLGANFAMVTTSPEALSLEQRLPHVDALDPGRMAIVHYLSPGDTDGTAFYRHRATGFETITAARSAAYFAALNADLAAHGQPAAAYLCGDTAIFEQTGVIGARFNSALIYRSRVLHSGAISAGRVFASDPLTGRLTVTCFLAAA